MVNRRTTAEAALLVALACAALACKTDALQAPPPGAGGVVAATSSSGAGGSGGGVAAAGGGDVGGGACDVPTDPTALLAWLEAGNYSAFPAESAPHVSLGPHFGNVRTFINPTLDASLSGNENVHPVCSAAVKELYEGTFDEVRGWAVAVKVNPGFGDGDNWFWYERLGTTEYASEIGASLCTGCHSGGLDFVRTTYPLQ